MSFPWSRYTSVSVSMLALAAAAIGGCGGDDGSDDLPDGVAARVGEHVIRESAVRAQLNRSYAETGQSLKAMGPPHYQACVDANLALVQDQPKKELVKRCKSSYEVARAQVVNAFVHEQWLRREAQRRGVDSDRAIDKALARANELRASIPNVKPMNAKDVKFRVFTLQEKLRSVVPASNQEVREYGQLNADVYYEWEKRTARVLETDTKRKATRALARLRKSRAAWPDVQRRYDAYRLYTGDGVFAKNTVVHDAFGRSLFTAQPHKLIGPIRTANGYFVFEVLDIRPPRHKGLSAYARERAGRTVRGNKLDQAMLDRYGTQTTCAPEYTTAEAPQCQTAAAVKN
jgi:parvulin-like peptidyl-prolyl isomerase